MATSISLVDQLFKEPSLVDQVVGGEEPPVDTEQPPAPKRVFNLPATPYDDIMKSASEEHGVPYEILYSNTRQESQFNPKAVSKTGARGVAQFMPGTAKDMGVADPHDPVQAIPGSAKYLRQLYDEFGDWKLAVAAYNAGPKRVREAGNKIPNIAETQEHVKRVFRDGIGDDTAPITATAQKTSDNISLVNQLFKNEEPIVTPKVPAKISKVVNESVDPREYYTRRAADPFTYGIIHPAVSAKMGMAGFGPKPGGWDELGRPTDENGVPYANSEGIDKDKLGNPIAETLKGLSSLAAHPMEVIRGGLDFVLSAPGFGVGLLGAAGRGGKTLVDQLAYGKLDLDKVYESMTVGMEESMKFFEPGKALVVGEPTKESQLVGQIVMAPMNVTSKVFQDTAGYEGFNNSPNIRGALKITGDVVALMSMGYLLHGGSRRAEFAKEVEGISNEAKVLADKEIQVNQSLDTIVKNVQLKELQVQKQMLEAKAAQFAKKFGDDIVVIEEAGRQAEQIAQEKMRPVVESQQMVKLDKKLQKEEAKVDVEPKVEELKKDAGPEVGETIVDPKTGKKTFKVKEEVERRSQEYVPTTVEETLTNFPTGKETDALVNRYRMEDNLHMDGEGNYKLDSYLEASEIAKDKGGTVIPVSDGKFAVALEPQKRVMFEKSAIDKGAEKQATRDAEQKLQKVEPKVEPKRKKVEAKPTNKRTLDVKESKAELGPVYDLIGKNKYKAKRKVNIEEHNLQPGEPAEISPTWHDGVYRHTVLRDADGNLTLGRSGSYDSIMMPGQVAGAKSGPLQPGTTLYIVDTGPYPNQISGVKIYRTAPLTKELPKPTGEQKVLPAPGPKPAQVTEVKTVEPKLDKKFNELEVEEELSPKAKAALDRMIELTESEDIVVEPKKSVKPSEKIDYLDERKISDVDTQTGTETLEITGDKGVFWKDKEKTLALDQIYKERRAAVESDPEVYIQKLINDIRMSQHGDKTIDIDAVRNKISEMAARSDELRDFFMTGADHLQFTELAREAAKWARGVGRSGSGKDVSTRLNAMVPIDKLPGAIRMVLRELKSIGPVVRARDVYRNKEMFEKTGFWFGKDGKWRYELDDSKATIEYENLVKQSAIGEAVPLESVYKHPTLYNHVPEMYKTQIVLDNNIKSGDGYYNIDLDTIKMNGISKKLIAHEVQHAINIKADSNFKGTNVARQRDLMLADRLDRIVKMLPEQRDKDILNNAIKNVREKYHALPMPSKVYELLKDNGVKGLTPEIKALLDFPMDAYEKYSRDPGEMESRVVERRLKMTPEERRSEAPWETLDKMLESEGRFSDVGHRLYSGDPAIEAAAKLIVAGAKKVGEYTTKARGMKNLKPGEAFKMARQEFNRAFIDRSGNIRRELLDKLSDDGYEILQKLVLSKGASARSAAMLKQMRSEVYGGLNRRENKILDDIIFDDRMIDIAKYKGPTEYNYPGGMKPADFIAHRELFPQLEGLSLDRAQLLDARAKAYSEWMKKPLKDMLESGLISQAEYDLLISHNYRKTKLIEIFDKKRPAVGTKGKSVYDSGVEALSRGRETDIYEPSSEIMALEVFNRSYGRILNNEANKTLIDLAKKDPTNGFARVKDKDNPIPTGWHRVFAYEGGERKSVYISPDMAKEWINSSPEMSYRLSQFIRWSSGSVVTRTFATGIEWGFALANLPRDMMHLWFAARTFENGKWNPIYNANLPVYGLQIGRDIATVFSDAALKKGRYNDYINEGGGMEFLVHQGRLFQRGRHLEGPMDKIYNVLGYLGETSEVMTRLAIRERVIRNRAKEQGLSMEEAKKDKKIRDEATFAARDYMDFGSGGGITKALDNGMPYLNATVVGTRGLARTFIPGSGTALSSTYKLAQLAALTTGVYIAAKSSSPNTMKALQGDVAMQNNLCIPLGDQFSFLDEQGQERYMYFKIPLDPGQKFFKTFFEASADKWLGNEVDVDRVTGSLTELSPVGMSSLPPTISGALGYATNKNFWLNEDIWKGSNKPFSYPNSKEEYTDRTPQAYKDFGQVTGASPERTKYAVEQLVTQGSMWSYLLNQGYNKTFGDLTKERKEQHIGSVLSQVPIAKRFFGITKPYAKYASKFDEAEEMSTLKKFTENRGMDTLVDSYLYGVNTTREQVADYALSFEDPKTFERLMERFRWEEAIQDLPEKAFWKRMKGLDTDAKAKMFVDRLKNSTPKEAEQLWQEFAVVGANKGIITEDFILKMSEQMPE